MVEDIKAQDTIDNLRPGGSAILPEETHPKFYARHLSAYNFVMPYVRGKDILEVGFGDGYGANFLADYANYVRAADVLERNVTLASNKYRKQNLEFIKSDALSLDFPEGIFDAVISFQVIEHIEGAFITKYLTGIKRVLKKDGFVFISTLNLDMNKKPNKLYTKNPYHVKEFTYHELDAVVREVFGVHDIYGLFAGARLNFYERLKKIGIFRYLPEQLNIVDRYYKNITVDEFVWKKQDLNHCLDFMAVCRK